MTIPLSVGADDQYRAVLRSIRHVRAAARHCYAVLFAAEAAGASIEQSADGDVTLRPNGERSKAVLAAMGDQAGKAHVYELRRYVLEHLCPTIRSFVWDDLRRLVSQRWRARDPQFPTAGRGWLSLQGARNLAMFRGTGIGFPATVLAAEALQPHAITLTWDREIGSVEFGVGTLDPGRWHRWSRVVSGEMAHGTIVLNERDGRLSLLVSYEEAGRAADLVPDRAMTVRLTEDGAALAIVGPDGDQTYDRIELVEAVAWCARLAAQQAAWSARRAACGNPRKPWGERRRFRAVAEHGRRVTVHRENGVRSRNHAWAKRIVTRAADWRCAVVVLDVAPSATIGGHPWGWHHLGEVIGYKMATIGGRFVRPEPPAD